VQQIVREISLDLNLFVVFFANLFRHLQLGYAQNCKCRTLFGDGILVVGL
jgi:hypothetical protein